MHEFPTAWWYMYMYLLAYTLEIFTGMSKSSGSRVKGQCQLQAISLLGLQAGTRRVIAGEKIEKNEVN